MEDIFCPVCGMEASTYYVGSQREIVGCSECLRAVDVNELEAESAERAYCAWLDHATDELIERRCGIGQ